MVRIRGQLILTTIIRTYYPIRTLRTLAASLLDILGRTIRVCKTDSYTSALANRSMMQETYICLSVGLLQTPIVKMFTLLSHRCVYTSVVGRPVVSEEITYERKGSFIII